MAQSFQNTQLNTQKDESGLVELFNLSRLVQTVNSIAIEAKDEKEMLQLTINALCIFTGWPLGHIFLRDSTHKTVFRCSDTHYVKYDLYIEPHQEISSNTYDESNLIIKQIIAHPTPFIYQGAKPVTLSNIDASFKVLIPMVSRGELFGFFELVALKGDGKPNQHLMQVFHQVGYRVGSVLDSFISSENLETAKNKSEALLSSIGDAVFAIDKEQNIVHLNRRGEELSGYKTPEVLGKPYYEFLKFIKEKDGSENFTFITTALRGEISHMEEHTLLIRKDGSKLPVSDTAAPLKNKEGDIIGAIVVFRDATQEREIERLRDEFVYIAVHELRSPATAVRAFLELVSDSKDKLPKDLRDLFGSATAANAQVRQLIDDLLEIARSESETLKIDIQPLDIIPLINATIKELSPTAKQKRVTIKMEAIESVPEIFGNSKKVTEVISNLLSNAIKYNREGGNIDIRVFTQDSTLITEIRDTGYGIPKEQQARVFQKFFRAKGEKTREVLGTGLGLFITRMLVEKMSGKIMFSSVEGKGSTFTFSLPTTT